MSLDSHMKRQRIYRELYVEAHGDGPWPCHFECGRPVEPGWDNVPWRDRSCVHHKNGLRGDNRPENLAMAHWDCHARAHMLNGQAEHIQSFMTPEQRSENGRRGGLVGGAKGYAAGLGRLTSEERSAMNRRNAFSVPRERRRELARARALSLPEEERRANARRAVAAVRHVSCPHCGRTMRGGGGFANHVRAHERQLVAGGAA